MVRVMRMVAAARAVPRITLGRMSTPRFPSGSSLKGTHCIGGDHAHHSDGYSTTMVASQKLGVARPMMATERPT